MTAAPPGRTATVEGALAASGLDPARAEVRLRELGLWADDGPGPDAMDLVELVSDAASPEDALHVMAELAARQPERYAGMRADSAWCRRVVALAGASRPLGDLLARHADALDGLRDPGAVDAAEVARQVSAGLAAAEGRDARASAVAAIRRRTTAAIAARDLTGAVDVEEVGRDLARLAEGVLAGTVEALHAEIGGRTPAARLAIIGMGKLGGEELNYVSDVDVIFVHEPTGGAAGAGAEGEQAARDEAQRAFGALLQLLNASTTMGRAYEVDPTLRPEGRDGPLSRTVQSFVTYWERWAETWEFQALLKARPVGGDRALGERLLAAAERFVFPEQLDPDAIARVRDMKGRVQSKHEVVRHGARQLKLGPGGLRDIEFAVQLLQLVHGRADRTVRARGTLPALAALARGGYVARDDATTFADAYRELRRVEHRLQLAHERRTHTVPDDPEAEERLARSLGFRPVGDEPARSAFLGHLRRVQADVRGLHAKLFYRPLLEVHAAVPASDAALVDAGTAMPQEAAVTRLEALGFRDGRGVLRDLQALTAGVSRTARTLRVVLPAMLHAFADSPDPDAGMRALRTLVESHAGDGTLVAALRDQPPAADLLARLLGTSEVVGELLISQPQGIEWIADAEARALPRDRDSLATAALGMLRWQSDLAGRQAVLRRFKRRELARIVVRDLGGDSPVSVVGGELTALGEACLEAGLAAVLQELGAGGDRSGAPADIAVVGLGKLGGGELHYASDLDVVFVHEPVPGADDTAANTFAMDVAERVLTSLSAVTAEGTAFEVDAELRPEGRSGPLSRSLGSCRVYYERWAQPWEHQALLKGRHVAGSRRLGRAFIELARAHAYPADFGRAEVTAMRKMKARIERERIPKRSDPARHLKLGPGGLSDIEWTVQLLQRRHGWREPLVRTTSTMGAIDALQDAGVLDVRDAEWLRDGHRFLTRVRNRLYLLRQHDVDSLPTSAPVVEKLARSLGYGRGGRQHLEADQLRHSRRVRRVTERLFYGLSR
ncbi:MAG TPA: bifunctional [glutamine synthetase] adenylyltransferase/[glutamine synthetase]-adenylyl-L-tyrosine phosphorylase [Nitriliruptorales bacterium]|nr:bifunctional [glutamine synthetase] adenylyltransferase/[glutamine synthetase]-adenylyl-L-tyrosine phosphorylase [Nitriliruptorales bacterium]